MPLVQILYWRDIPAQVRVLGDRRPLTQQLPASFQLRIDRVAMHEGLTGTDQYLEQWHWGDKQERDGDPHALLRETVTELIATHEADLPPATSDTSDTSDTSG